MAEKDIIQSGKVQTQEIVYVSPDSPLSTLPKNHPMYPYVVVKEEILGTDVVENAPDLSSEDAAPFVSSTVELSSRAVTETPKFDAPTGLNILSTGFTMRPTIDGSMRVSAKLSFNGTIGADDYEYQIMSVEG